MEITYLGHSSFKIKGKEAVIVTDPFDSGMVGIKYPKVSADIVTISHDHADHNQAALVADSKKVISGPGEYEVQGVSILGFGSYHDAEKGEERGRNTIFVFEMEKTRLAHLGDLGHRLNEEMLEKMGDIDILMIPVGGYYSLDVKQAAEVVRDIGPKITIPMHYLTKEISKAHFGRLSGVEAFVSEVSLPKEETERLIFKKEIATEEQKLVILVRK